MRRLALFLLLIPCAALAQTQSNNGFISSTQCVAVPSSGLNSGSYSISGTWSGTITAFGVVGQGSAVSLGSQTGNGSFTATITGYTLFELCGNTVSSGTAFVQVFSSVSVGGGGVVPGSNCGDASHALGWNGSAYTCQAITGAALAGGSTTQLQWNNATALGGIAQFTTNGTTTITSGATGILDLHAAGTGGLLLPGALATGLVTVTTSTGAISITTPPANTTATASNWFTAYNSATGAFTKAQPAFTDITGSVTLAQHATQALNTVVMNATAGTASPTAVSMPTCTGATNADIYDTTSHAWACNPITGGGTAWSSLTNGSGNLSITTGGTSIFNTTTALNQFFAFKNTTAAVVGTSQGSPVHSLCGTAFHASASAEDCLTLSELPGNGNDAAIAFNVGHTGTSTGVVTTNFPGPVASAASGSGVGGGFICPEGTAISGIASSDILYCDSTAHRMELNNNNGGAFPIPQLVASGTSAMGTGAITSGTCATVVTTAATGAATTDNLIANPTADPTGVTGYAVSATGSLYIQAYITSGNVNFKVCNNTSGSLTPAALTMQWRVMR